MSRQAISMGRLNIALAAIALGLWMAVGWLVVGKSGRAPAAVAREGQVEPDRAETAPSDSLQRGIPVGPSVKGDVDGMGTSTAPGSNRRMVHARLKCQSSAGLKGPS